MTQRAFAELVGFSDGFISQLINGHDRCGRNAALQIVERTRGAITLERILTWKPQVVVTSEADRDDKASSA